jgi:hypothetical protein
VKIKSLLMCSALMSTNALAHSVVELETSYVEVSAINFKVKSKVFNVKDDTDLGVRVKYGWEKYSGIGYEFSYQSISFEDDEGISIDADLGLLSLNYNHPIHYNSSKVNIKSSLGAIYSNVESKIDANYFIKLTFDCDLIKDKLNSSVYVIHKNLNDNIWGNMTYGMTVNYNILRDVYLTFSGEKSGDIDIASLGFGMKF